MNRQKLFSFLTLLGLGFIIFLIVSGVYNAQNRGEVLSRKVEVPDEFARHFSRVITKNREQAMEEVRFINPEGQDTHWDDFDGEYLLVNFWATWCPPCVVELPSLDKLEKKFRGQGLKVIAVSLDTQHPHTKIKDFLDQRNIGQFAAYLDDYQQINTKISMRGLPTSYLLDPKGNILHIFEGDAPWYAAESIDFFRKILNQ